MNVKDINEFLEFNGNRHTNPLSPRYIHQDENNNKIEYGKLDNKNKPQHPIDVNREISYDLRTNDIDGAQADTSTAHLRKLQPRKIGKTDDIFGAQAATLKKGIISERKINPLNPNYRIPGNSEEAPNFSRNTSYITKPLVNTNTNSFGSTNQKVVNSAVKEVENRVEIKSNESKPAELAESSLSNFEHAKSEIKRPAEFSKSKKEERKSTLVGAGEKTLQFVNSSSNVIKNFCISNSISC